MKRRKHILFVGALCLLGACATLVEEVRGQVVVDGVAYETRTRTYARADGSGFTSTKVIFHGQTYYCSTTGDHTCADTVRDLINGNHLNHPGRRSVTPPGGGGYTPPI
ncbi:hypothetical protein [uncultured Roseobacter sp.]|uniref:hypothetical protein n=1 Tax=uncultured Roseobacter sp. TaxID=114847 RepID=UPI00262D6A82|nr:hypothetical protein [uncultured Roseobacter sp.]